MRVGGNVSDTRLQNLRAAINDTGAAMSYEHAVVSFVDILGFKALVETRAAKEINQILSRLETTAQPFMMAGEEKPIVFMNFSDTVVRISPLSSKSNRELILKVSTEMMDLASSQALLAQRGVLLRGGMTVGEIAYADRRIFGPAMNRAYQLESEHARFPRIVLDPSLSQRLRRVLEDFGDERPIEEYYLQQYAGRDSDLYFIDYVGGVCEEEADSEEAYHFLRNHAHVVRRGLETHTHPRTIEKYEWLKTYHNNYVRGWTERMKAAGRSIDEYLVPDPERPGS
ncbi:MAG TPA: hypothetical protein VFS20_21595 [Longimicrobium sp.]|nr:hypothetical protein [Longimicrobium sp.]